MSNLADFSAGGVPIGSHIALPYTAGNLVTIAGVSLLRTGVTALQSAYPQIPHPAFTTLPVGAPVTTNITGITLMAASPSLFVGTTTSTSPVQFVSSPDGVTWTLRGDATAAGTVPVPAAMTWTGTVFVSISIGAGVYTSPDGLIWTKRTLPNGLSGTIFIVGNGANIFMGSTGTGSSYLYSTNSGATWTSAAPPNAGNAINGAIYMAGLFVVTCNLFVYTSPDLVAWTQRGVTGSTNLAAGNGFAIAWATGAITTVYRSTDMLTWTAVVIADPALSIGATTYVSWGTANGVIALFASNSTSLIATSTDGISWRMSHAGYATLSGSYPIVGNGALAFTAYSATQLMKYTAPGGYVDNFTQVRPSSAPANSQVAYLRVA